MTLHTLACSPGRAADKIDPFIVQKILKSDVQVYDYYETVSDLSIYILLWNSKIKCVFGSQVK